MCWITVIRTFCPLSWWVSSHDGSDWLTWDRPGPADAAEPAADAIEPLSASNPINPAPEQEVGGYANKDVTLLVLLSPSTPHMHTQVSRQISVLQFHSSSRFLPSVIPLQFCSFPPSPCLVNFCSFVCFLFMTLASLLSTVCLALAIHFTRRSSSVFPFHLIASLL